MSMKQGKLNASCCSLLAQLLTSMGGIYSNDTLSLMYRIFQKQFHYEHKHDIILLVRGKVGT